MASSSTQKIQHPGPRSNPGDISAALLDVRLELQKRERDRTGEVLDEPVTHGKTRPLLPKPAPALFPEYCDHLEREARDARNLTLAELEARHDAAEAELMRRGRA